MYDVIMWNMFTILKSTAMDGGLLVSRADQEDNRTCKHFLYINFVYRYELSKYISNIKFQIKIFTNWLILYTTGHNSY